MKAFLIDVAKCNGCHNCQISCKDEHCGTAWMPYAADQPTCGQFWCKVDEKVRGSVPVVRVSYTPLVCGHCADAPCMAAAKDGAVYRRDDGLVIIDPVRAKGQRAIMEACPMGAVYWNDDLDLPQKCTGCAHLLDDGWSEPRCVDACPTGALAFGEEDELDLAGAELLEPVAGLGAHAWYKNLPKRFVAGCVVDFEAREVCVGTEVSLLDEAGAEAACMTTDDFGDFMFDQVEPAAYTVRIAGKELAADAREKDVNLGDVACA
ncbi:4Fe-4S dicluster domain-containing protein [Gordonibacter massiliensis (ex Traore et al. 2017)]|uniref:4Fe-4S dicluster domain-containing protein n=1 Tax=Gordonibacter massiliensis (ex Traore et al. 2017) TaxID=1841863 RepID=UPI001C8CCFC9|nr:4Fe-4S dicluster domain-containing protein [Gordonibacter massiliensis (ex Traore et al. 2017)]MBX9034964.1 oxidoreductase [Gordonibacter massiliensis (ex Traore et al. 2017)]